jgi:hypothetical protein
MGDENHAGDSILILDLEFNVMTAYRTTSVYLPSTRRGRPDFAWISRTVRPGLTDRDQTLPSEAGRWSKKKLIEYDAMRRVCCHMSLASQCSSRRVSVFVSTHVSRVVLEFSSSKQQTYVANLHPSYSLRDGPLSLCDLPSLPVIKI